MTGLLEPYVKLSDVGDWQSIPDMDALPKHPKEKENKITENTLPRYKEPPVLPSASSKIAEEVKKKKTLARDAIMGGALAGSPFLGMIGEKPISAEKDPFIGKIKRTRIHELSRQAHPGDVVLVSPRKGLGSIWKGPQVYTSGNEFHHMEPVVARRRGHGITLTVDDNYDPFVSDKHPHTMQHHVRGEDNIAKRFKGLDAVLMRPKNPLTPKQQQALEKSYRRRLSGRYVHTEAFKTFMKDIFVPKVNGKSTPTHVNDLCSTLPSNAYSEATGRRVVPNKKPGDVMPADFLRENSNFETVVATVKGKPIIVLRLSYSLGELLVLG
jgi:hypothetical protein